MTKTLWVWLFMSSAGAYAAGPLSFGIRGGVPLTDFFEDVNSGNFTATSTTNRYIIGPTVELRLPFGFGFEVDALYRRLNYNSSFNLVDVFTNDRTTGNAWEFPLLAKYRLPTPLLKPFVKAGLAFDTLSGVKQTAVNTIFPNRQNTTTTSTPSELSNSTTEGFVIGFGADIKAIVVHISPEIRYTRWGSPHFKVPNGSTLSNQNQAEFLVGFTF
jgi:hypothetical protein